MNIAQHWQMSVFASVMITGTLLCLGPPARAQDALSLTDAITLTLNRHPELKAFGYELRAQDARVQQAQLHTRPELSVAVEDVLGTGVAQGLSGAQTTVSIAWIREDQLRQRRIDAARTGSLVLADEAEIRRLDAAATTARYFVEALSQQTHRSLADEAIAQAREMVTAVQQRVSVAATGSADLSRAQAELARRELAREDINHELSSTYHRLAAQWGDLSPQFTQVEGNPMALPQPDAFEALLQQIEQSPDLMRFISEQRMHQAILQLEMAQRSLPWRFNAGIRRIEGSSDTALVAGVTVPLNRGNRNQGRIEEVRIALEQTAAERDARHLQLRTALYVFYQELQHSLHRAELLEQTVIPRYREAMNHIRQAYESGAASYTEWIQVQDELLSARMELLETSVMAHLNLIEIERLTGLPVQQTSSNQSNPLP